MHVLTKVFVVLAAVLSVALSCLVIAYAVNTDKVAADYRGLLAQNAAITASANDQRAQGEQERVKLRAELEHLRTTNSNLVANIRELEALKSSLLIDKNKAESSRQSIEGKIAELGETARTQAELIESYRKEVTTLRTNELAYRQRALEMEDRLSDLESQREVLEQNYRALQEQLADINRSQSPTALAGSFRSAAAADRPVVYTGPSLKGSVASSRVDSASGKTLAQLSLGSNDGVIKGMKFIVHRGNDYIASVMVVQTDLQWSIAEVIGQPKGSIQPGDQIMSSTN